MNGYYETLRRMKNLLISDPEIHTVTRGDAREMDLSVKTIFPLGHIFIGQARFPNENVIVFPVVIWAVAQRDVTNEEGDKFTGGDNEDDTLNAMLYVLQRFYRAIKINGEDMDIKNPPSLVALTEEGQNLYDGWRMSFDIEISSDRLEIIDIPSCD